MLARSVNEDGLDFTDRAGKRSNSAESVWAYDYGKGRAASWRPPYDQRSLESRVRKDAEERSEMALRET